MQTINFFLFTLGVGTVFFGVPFLISYGWSLGRQRGKKICDICWRDLAMVSKAVKDSKADTTRP